MNDQNPACSDDLMPEYDFSQGVQGKHYKVYREGHSVTIHKLDGATETQFFTLAEGAVMLDPDVHDEEGPQPPILRASETHVPPELGTRGRSVSGD